jgi:hypothetical protein
MDYGQRRELERGLTSGLDNGADATHAPEGSLGADELVHNVIQQHCVKAADVRGDAARVHLLEGHPH